VPVTEWFEQDDTFSARDSSVRGEPVRRPIARGPIRQGGARPCDRERRRQRGNLERLSQHVSTDVTQLLPAVPAEQRNVPERVDQTGHECVTGPHRVHHLGGICRDPLLAVRTNRERTKRTESDAVTDPAAVPDAVAAVLGIIQQPGKSVSESVAAALQGRVRLLVIDNCGHVLDAAADLVEAILARSAAVTILATSREGLGIADEQLWPVPSLDVGAGINSAAVELFVERARSVSPRFSMDNTDDATAVVEICGRLDGIPLAIELAASRIASMTAAQSVRWPSSASARSP
jgi:hypothetical protein